MAEKVNIVVPAIQIDEELLKCLKEINKINYSNFFVTIVLDHQGKRIVGSLEKRLEKLLLLFVFVQSQ